MKNLSTFLFASILCILFFLPHSSFAQLPFSDGFESGNLDNWTADGDTAVVSTDPFEGASCFQGNNFYQMQKLTSPVSDDIVIIEFAMKAAQDNKESVDFLVYDESSNALARLYFASTGSIISKNGPSDVSLKVYTSDVWYEVKIIIDQVGRDYTVVIDGDTLGLNFDFIESSSSNASRFYFSGSESEGSVAFIDDVSIYIESEEIAGLHNFDSYSVDDFIAVVSDVWDTWSHAPGGAEDAPISNEQASSAPNSVKISGTSDVIFPMGDKTTGRYKIGFEFYVPDTYVGYFNMGHFDNPGDDFALDCKLNTGGNGIFKTEGKTFDFTYNSDAWNNVELIVDLDNDWAKFSINDIEIHQWKWSEIANGGTGTNQIGCLDFFASTSNGTPLMYIDDFLFEELDQINCSNIGLTGEFNSWGGSADHALTQNSYNPYNWSTEFTLADDGDVKFRQDNAWDVSWGAVDFPEGIAVLAGDNIPALAGTYQVNFNCESAYYRFGDGSNKDALIAFYHATNGDDWTDNTNWNSEADISEWFGITTNGEGNVIEIYLPSNNLTGYLPVELENLNSLISFNVYHNSITGDFVEGLYQISSLEILEIEGNDITGTMPSSFAEIPNLTHFNIGDNNFSGTIPADISLLSQLATFSIWNSDIGGDIPAAIWNLTTITTLDLGGNNFSGQIPAAIGNLVNLDHLYLYYNDWDNYLPEELWTLTNLQVFSIAGNSLTGDFPVGILNLTQLIHLFIQDNNFTGDLPSEIASLTSLIKLHINHNQFSGELPQEIAALTSLNEFKLNNNYFDEIPVAFKIFVIDDMDITYNELSYEDIENLPNFAGFSPQQTIHIYDTTFLEAGVEGLITLSFDGSVNNSSYNWYSNEEFVSTTSGNSIIANLSNPGTFYYNLEITNTDFPGFTLKVDSVVVIVLGSTNYSTNFDEYIVGDYLAVVDAGWDTWSNAPGTSEDALITSEFAQSELNSVKVRGTTDVIYRMGNKTSGRHQLSMAVYVPTGNVGYFNVEHTDVPGEEFALDCDFRLSGEGELRVGDTIISFTYVNDEWNEVLLIVDIDNDWTIMKVNGTEIYQWQWSLMTNGSIGTNQLGCLDFFAKNTYGTPYFYFDDVVLTELDPVNCSNIGLTGTFNEWGASPDHVLTQDANEPYKWLTSFTLASFSEIKLRQNEAWDVNWADDSFPIGYGIQDGSNIPVPAGEYNVLFNCESGYYNFESESERSALMAIYNATDGDNWTTNTNWDTDEPIDSWYGVLTNELGQVDSIWLGNNNLVGSIPYEIGNLSSLISLGISGNTLSGDLPSTIGNLTNLQRLSASQCQLSGSIPVEIGNLTNLTWLALWQNDFSGDIPDELWDLFQIEYLWLGSNPNLSGTLPNDIGSFTNLKKLWIDGTSLVGSIPGSISSLTQLEVLNLANNKMDSYITDQIVYLSSLQDLDLSGNDFHGELFPLENSPNLNAVLISGNRFDNIQGAWSSITLDSMNVQNNQMTFYDLLNLPAIAVYDPQDTITFEDTTFLKVNITGTIQLDFDETVSDNSYQWFRNGVFAANTSGNSIMATENEAGTVYFSVVVTNPAFPDFSIIGDSIVVITEECEMELNLDDLVNVNCAGANDGAINVSVFGGAPDYSYSWTGPDSFVANTEDINSLIAGDYVLTVIDSDGCEIISDTYGITEPDALLASELITDLSCNSDGLGAIDITITGGSPDYNFEWNGPSGFYEFTEDISGLDAGEYNLYVSDANSCTESFGPYTVNEPESELSYTEEVNDVLCYGDLTGQIIITVDGGTPPYEYSKDPVSEIFQSSNIFEGLYATNWTITVRDANLCTSSHSVTVAQPESDLDFMMTVTNLLCVGVENGMIEITAAGGTPDYEYSIDNGATFQTSNIFTGLGSGEYFVIVKDANNCEASDETFITEPTEALSFTEVITDVLCSGDANGSIEITAFGGTPDYEFSIDNGSTYQTTALFTGLIAGDYDVMVRDANNCTSGNLVTISEPANALSFTATPTDVLCSGDANGEINFIALDGTAPYEYSIDNGSTYQTTTLFTGLVAGDYDVMVRDANLCTSGDFVTISEPVDVLTFTAIPTDILCSGDANGEISFDALGGTPAYEYSIDNGSTYQTSALFTGLIAGDYDVMVRDANLCTSGDFVTISEPVDGLSFTATPTDILCNGEANGEISFDALGGTPAYEYSIDNGSTYQTSVLFTGLIAGDYDVMVRDANLCTSGDFVTISEPVDGLNFTATPTDILCSGEANGKIDFDALGGTPAYEYSIDNGSTYQTSALFTGLIAGDYNVMVRDANLCTSGDFVTISEPVDGLSFTATPTDILCSGEANGEIDFDALGGTPTYEYSIDNGSTYQTSALFTGLVAGDYDVIVRDANLCTSGDMVTISEPINALSFTTTLTDVLCSGDASGEIEFEALDGLVPYEYSIDNGTNYQTIALFTGLIAGDYDLMVRDANLCTIGDMVTISEPINPLSFTATPIDVLCSGDASGEIDFVALDGLAPYEYSIDNGASYQTIALFTGLNAGDYDVMVRDANLCTIGDMVTISEPINALSFTTTPTDVLCSGDASGEIEFVALDGLAPYEYSIDNGTSYQTTALFTGLNAGDFDVIVRDANLCTSGDVVTISEPVDAVSFTTVINNVTCFGGNDGELTISASGGTASYEYSINGGTDYQVSNIFTGLLATDYDVFVRDANLCETNQIETVSEPSALPTVNFTGLDPEYCETSAAVIITGNQAPEGTFTGSGIFDNGDGTATFTPITAGIGGPYEITYTYIDPDGCSNFETQETSVTAPIIVSFTGLDLIYCIDNAAVLLTGSEAPEGIFTGTGITDNGDGTATFDPAIAGIGGPYDIMYQFTDASTCVSEITNQTTVNDLPVVSFIGLNATSCLGDPVSNLVGSQAPNGTFTGTGIVDNGDGTATFDPGIAGLGGPYDITYSYTDGNSCSNSDIQSTIVFDIPVVSFTGLAANYCDGDGEITITGSEAPNGTFSGPGVFDQGNGTALFYPVVAGLGNHDIVYSFENASGCTGTETQSTAVNELPTASFTGLDATYCVNNAIIVLSGNYAPDGEFTGAGITDNGDGTAIFDPALAGAGGPYNIIYSYTSPEGCFDDETKSVEVFSVDDLTFTIIDPSYCDVDAPIDLLGSIAPNGSFNGPGITDNGDGTAIFDPVSAGVGSSYSIIYFYTNANSCYSEIEQLTEVIETPVVSFTGLDEDYCIDAGNITLTGDEPLGSFSGVGITDNGNGTAIFNPNTAGAGGPYTIIFSYTNAGGCTGEFSSSVEVYDYVSVSFTGLESNYCSYDDPDVLVGNQVPFGIFSGPGITDNNDGTANFDPVTAGIGGPYTIVYEFYDGYCVSTTEQTVNVNQGTPISFTGLEDNYCDENVEHLLTGSEAPEGYFLGQGIMNNGEGTATFTPSIPGAGGPYAITYYFENDLGCTNSTELFTNVIEGPSADFHFDLGACNEDAAFLDQSTSSNGDIVSWAWSFDDPDSEGGNTSNDQNPLHGFVSNQSSFNIELIVADEMSCKDTIKKMILPFSTSTITGNVVSNEGQLITDGYVLAFLFSDGVISTQEDSVSIQSDGTYKFIEMASCVDYIFHAYANEEAFPAMMPRWYVGAAYWFDATPISLAWEDVLVEDIDISLYKIIPPELGTSEIGGGVYNAGSKGEPIKNIDVVLEYDDEIDKADEIVGYRPTDEFGQWGFDKLPEGKFKIKLDIPGLTMDSIYTIDIQQPYTVITGLNYYVDTTSGIFTDFTGIDEYNAMTFGTLSVFPNPNNGKFYIDIQKSDKLSTLDIQSIELWDMEGRMVKDFNVSFKGERFFSSYSLTDISPGMYFIKVKNDDSIGVRKLLIQK